MRFSSGIYLRLMFDGKSMFQCLGGRCSSIKLCVGPFRVRFSAFRAKSENRIVLAEMERALKEHRVEEACRIYKSFKGQCRFQDSFVMENLITQLSYSSSAEHLCTACDLVVSVARQKPALLRPDVMAKLLLSLARAQIPVSASSVLRLMLERRTLPSLDVLQLVFMHLVKTDAGMCLAANILTEICDCIQMSNGIKSRMMEFKIPDATIFNLVLDACVKFGSSLRGQQIIELMAKAGVTGDANTVLFVARIHQMNGTRDELKKFQDSVSDVPASLFGHYQQFYECLLSLHFMFNDIDAASALLMDMCGQCNPISLSSALKDQQKPVSVSIGSDNLKMGLRLQFLPQKLQKNSVCMVQRKQELVLYKNGKFVLSINGLAKFVLGYKRLGRNRELSKFLISMQNILSSSENGSLCSDVIDTCIHLGWLETAHDILEDLESEKYFVTASSYASLLAAYYSKNMFKEAEVLVRHMRKVGKLDILGDNFSESNGCNRLYLKQLCSAYNSDLAVVITQNMREQDSAVSPLSLEYTSSIYFFAKAKMIEDAVTTYHKMQKMKIPPTASTFFHLIKGYSSMRMYHEISLLWVDIKWSMEYQNLIYQSEIYEELLLNFIRGGYFERVLEVIDFMNDHHMFLDKWCYKTEFLKFHRDLYRTLTEPGAKTEAQSKRINHVRAFRKWAGIV